MHDASKPWPTSYNGKGAVRCDKQGNPQLRGHYITWEELLPSANVPTTLIAKLFKPEKDVEPLDYREMKKELKSNSKYNLLLGKVRSKLQSRLLSVMGRMGINYLDALNVTHVSAEIDTACWATDTKSEAEYILINPYLLSQKRSYAAFLLQHEAMHRALYRGRKHLTDRVLLNVVLDICINRILASNHSGRPSKNWNKFCQWIYPAESKLTLLALCNASLTENDLRRLRRVNPVYAAIWEEVYGKMTGSIQNINPQTGRTSMKNVGGLYTRTIANLNPDELYFRLKNQLNEADKAAMLNLGQNGGHNPFGQRGKEVSLKKSGRQAVVRCDANDIASMAAKRIEDAMRKNLVPKRFRSFAWRQFSDDRTEFWDKYVLGPEDLHDEDLAKYAKKIYTDKVLNDVVGSINRAFQPDIVTQPYPQVLSEEGTMLAVLGLRPPKYPFFNNLEGQQGKRRVMAFFDLSPSMSYYFPYMIKMCESFENEMDLSFARNDYGEAGVMTFAGSVRPLTAEEVCEMKRGTIYAGQSTCFDSMIEYCVDQIHDNDVDAIICFTDGESAVSRRNKEAFNATAKKLYRIYFIPDTKANRDREIYSDLDELNGTSFTLALPMTDMEVI